MITADFSGEYLKEIDKIMDLCKHMERKDLQYEDEIKNNQEYLKTSAKELKDLNDEISSCYARMIEKHLSEWWEWFNENKQLKLFEM